MLKSLVLLGAAAAAAGMAWGFFRVFGHYALLIMLAIRAGVLWFRAGPPGFSRKAE